MGLDTVAIVSPGDMGHAIGAALVGQGRRVIASLEGRSEDTRARAERSGIESVPGLDALVREADGILSILPPAAAHETARACAEAMRRTGCSPLYADCNAVAPATTRRIAAVVGAAGSEFVDGGIVGPPPGRGSVATRLYVSGPGADRVRELACEGERALSVRPLGAEVGRASGLKMVYAGLTKGTLTLHAAVLVVAHRLGVYPDLVTELQESQAAAWDRMGVLPFLPADAERWIGEMEEIAATFGAAGGPEGFHRAAAEVFRWMAATPWAAETRESLDTGRTLEEAVRGFAAILDPPERRQPEG